MIARPAAVTSYARLTAVGLGAAALAWLAISQSASQLLMDSQPGLAAAIGRGSIASQQNLSDGLLEDARTRADFAAVQQRSLEALSKAPLAQGLLRNAAIAASTTDRSDRPLEMMNLAKARTGRDTEATLWLFNRGLASDQFDVAVHAFDVVLRRQVVDPYQLTSRLITRLDEADLRQALAVAMAAGPIWRGAVIQRLAERGDPGQVSDIFDRLRALGADPTPAERGYLAAAWVEWGEYDRASALARQDRPSESLLADGEFDRSDSPLPFNWRLQNQQDSYAEISPLPGGGNGLRLEWRGAGVKSLAAQLVVLPPGSYTFKGRAMVEELPRGAWLTWKAMCVDSLDELARVRETATAPWHDIGVGFQVGADCPAVWLRLESSGGLPTQRGVAWFDKLALVNAAR